MNLQAELDCVLELVRECGPIAISIRGSGARVLAVRQKPLGGGPITAADRELNERIVERLAREFPGDGILAEESEDDGRWVDAERCWFVDPIDGTREFARGTAGWTIQIGLCIGGRAVLGVVAQPGHNRVSWAKWDGNAWASQTVQAQVSSPLRLAQRGLDASILIGGRAPPFSRQKAIRNALNIPRSRALSVGSVGARMTAVARGEADLYVQAPGKTKLWDTCAPLCLVEAARGVVTDLQGNPLRFDVAEVTHPAGVIACSPSDHAPILERVSPLADAWL